MAFSRGPKIITDGLVANLDIGNVKSFKGIPSKNILANISYNLGTNDTSAFKTNYGSEIVNIPKIQGSRIAHYCNIYNDSSTSCCPAPFFFGDIPVLGNTIYTYQIIYRTTTGYNHPNYMYHYEYNLGAYLTEYGLHSTSRMEDLGDGWVHAWGTFTSNASATRFVTYLFHYEYSTQNKIQVAGISLTQGSTVHNPNNLLPISVTRTSSDSLIDTSVKSNKITLLNGAASNRIIGSEAKESLVFDGINDNINLGNASKYLYNGVVSVNAWVTTNSLNEYRKILFTGDAGTSTIRGLYFSIGPSPFNIYFGVTTNNGQTAASHNVNLTMSRWTNLCGTYDGLNIRLYIDGVLVATQALTGDINTQGIARVSGYDNNNETWNGSIGGFQIYDRVLSSNEVLQNYNAIKSRYEI
jgi:hypothetical protein